MAEAISSFFQCTSSPPLLRDGVLLNALDNENLPHRLLPAALVRTELTLPYGFRRKTFLGQGRHLYLLFLLVLLCRDLLSHELAARAFNSVELIVNLFSWPRIVAAYSSVLAETPRGRPIGNERQLGF